MGHKKIGAFIAQCRKEKGLTQMQLAERLEITNQAISKWENGRGMPDMSLLQPLCDNLDISLNELFSGEHISEEEYKEKAEENISRLFKEKQAANLRPIKHLFGVCADVALIVAVIELAVGLLGNFIHPDTEILEAMLINASVWSVLFLAAFGKRIYDRSRLRKLKDSGICMDAEVEDVIPVALIRVGNYNTCRVSCKFSYAGKDYKAVSSYLILSPFKRKEDLFAQVYADESDFSKCSVELFQV